MGCAATAATATTATAATRPPSPGTTPAPCYGPAGSRPRPAPAFVVADAEHSIGIAGDWCAASAEHAATLEGAFLSGEALANHLAATPSQPAGLSLGADGGRFVPIEGAFGGAPPTASGAA